MDHLLDAYQRLSEQIPQVEAFGNLFAGDDRMRELLECIFIDLLEFHRRALMFFKKRSEFSHVFGLRPTYRYVPLYRHLMKPEADAATVFVSSQPGGSYSARDGKISKRALSTSSRAFSAASIWLKAKPTC